VDCRFDLADPPAARRRYLDAHVPGAVFLDLDDDLSDLSILPEIGGRHPLPCAEAFAAAAGRAGIGSDTFVVAYDEGMTGGAARLWWLLRHFGHDQVAVLDGGLQAWLGPPARARRRRSLPPSARRSAPETSQEPRRSSSGSARGA
jgi:thiosulfate/3-mercaptopyruvate sulfurtransferase